MAYDIIVQNIKDPPPEGYRPVQIMRPHVLGNPFFLKDIHDDTQREKCLAEHKAYLWEEMKKPDSPVMKALSFYADCANDLALLCCCSPKPCHGDTVKAAILWIRKNRTTKK